MRGCFLCFPLPPSSSTGKSFWFKCFGLCVDQTFSFETKPIGEEKKIALLLKIKRMLKVNQILIFREQNQQQQHEKGEEEKEEGAELKHAKQVITKR